jgi:L-Ala-D/L-Glu epimerase
MVKKIFFKKKELHFQTAFKIAYEEVEKTEVVFITLTDQKGNVGIGSVSAYEEVTGEKPEEIIKILEKKLTIDFFDLPLTSWYGYHQKIQTTFKGFPSVQSAVEEAYLDLWSKVNKTSLNYLYGGYRVTCPIMMTIGIKNLPETLADARLRLKQGYQIIKLKCGLDLEDDLKKIKAVRRLLPDKVQLILDANQGYTISDAKKLILTLKNKGITLIEQPIDAKNLNGLKKLTSLKALPVIADESVVSINDAIKLLADNYVDGLNIKLAKCGGPINFIKIFNLAKDLNKIMMLGCVYESNASITSGAHLALGLPVDFVDLDSGSLDFPDDPIKGGARVEKGLIKISGPLKILPNL